MTSIELNGAPYVLADRMTVHGLLEQIAGSTRGSAVVVDNEVVPRSQWRDVVLVDGQRVQLITAVQGG